MTIHRPFVWLMATTWVALAVILWLSVPGSSNPTVIIAESLQAESEPNPRDGPKPQPPRFTVRNATAENLGRLSEAIKAFAAANLELSALDISFHENLEPCGQHHGMFTATSESWQIRICSSDLDFVYEHELAHAWVTANVTASQRSAFMNLRGLVHWADQGVPWNERGTEWAAVTVQQGLSGLPLPPALSNEAKSRLESYELLTGEVAPALVNWIEQREVPCSDRPTNLSRPLADANGRTCTPSPSLTEQSAYKSQLSKLNPRRRHTG